MRTDALRLPGRRSGSRVGAAAPRLRYAARSISAPPAVFEYGYYLIIAYSVASAYLGIEVRLVAAGLTVALAAVCWLHFGPDASAVFAPISVLLACTISFIFVQVVFHGVSASEPIMRTFVLWTCSIVIVQSLCLRRGFVARCTLLICAVGLIAVPHLTFSTTGSVERAAAAVALGGNLRSANGLGGWFGFCLVSFILLGLETTRLSSRAFYWTAAAACLVVVGLTVSRGALFATALAVVVGCPGLLRRGVLPLLLLVVAGWLMLEFGPLGHIASLYGQRGMEETGRLLLWPHVFARIVESPLVGVGVLNISTYIPEAADSVSTPHNSFLFFALSSGVVPCGLWIVFWIQSGRRLFLNRDRRGGGTFRLPFFVYALVGFLVGDINIDPWVLLAIAVAAGPPAYRAGVPLRPGRAVRQARGQFSAHGTLRPRPQAASGHPS